MNNICPKVSVVMPSLNIQLYIRECMESVVNQTLRDIEIICVDAGSTDGTLEILQEYAEADERIKIITADRKSYGYQVNLGLKAAKGEYFAIVETDDFIALNMYEKLCLIADHYQLDMLKADFYYFFGEKRKREFNYFSIVKDESLYNKIIDLANDPHAILNARLYSWAGVYRRDFLIKNDIYHNETPGASYQDNGFWFQVFICAHRVMFYDKPFYMLRRDNPNSSVKSKEKVYCACDEHDFIRDILRHKPEVEQKFAPLCAYNRNNSYNFTLSRIADEFRLEFLQRYAQDFRKIRDNGELDRSLYSYDSWKCIQDIMEDPVGFYTKKYAQKSTSQCRTAKLSADKQTIAYLRHEIEAIHQSASYRIGRFITFIPRKIRGGIRCCKEHGLGFTMERVLVHLHLKKDPFKS